jgi:hypothetical protein
LFDLQATAQAIMREKRMKHARVIRSNQTKVQDRERLRLREIDASSKPQSEAVLEDLGSSVTTDIDIQTDENNVTVETEITDVFSEKPKIAQQSQPRMSVASRKRLQKKGQKHEGDECESEEASAHKKQKLGFKSTYFIEHGTTEQMQMSEVITTVVPGICCNYKPAPAGMVGAITGRWFDKYKPAARRGDACTCSISGLFVGDDGVLSQDVMPDEALKIHDRKRVQHWDKKKGKYVQVSRRSHEATLSRLLMDPSMSGYCGRVAPR